MSGHSKWSKIKHQKASTDALKGKLFTKLANSIACAIKEGGGIFDPDNNFRLRMAIEKARNFNMPKENIDRTIERFARESSSLNMTHAYYEGFAPGGIGLIIEAVTDNKQRTVSNIKNILERGGGTLAASGSVAHMFSHVGFIEVLRGERSDDQIMEDAIETGAADIEAGDTTFEIYTDPSSLHKVKEQLGNKGYQIATAELTFRPHSTVAVSDKKQAQQILQLLDSVEEIDDVQRVYANFDMPDEFLNV